LTNDPEGREFAPLELLTTAAYFADSVVSCRPWQRRHPDWPQPRRFHCVPLLRDVFGNPFRPVAFNPAWRTDTAVSLARQMYESKDFSAMPILADALQNAGCENEDVLNHCRDAKQAHVRGCWVVDLVLGKS
ncbi:MAG TPA: hypothetical protein VKE74_25030, partial [Gemmataceae bacterium]|nr:hypothetical protein [Gemmataceae bacterium]